MRCLVVFLDSLWKLGKWLRRMCYRVEPTWDGGAEAGPGQPRKALDMVSADVGRPFGRRSGSARIWEDTLESASSDLCGQVPSAATVMPSEGYDLWVKDDKGRAPASCPHVRHDEPTLALLRGEPRPSPFTGPFQKPPTITGDWHKVTRLHSPCNS